MTVRTFLRQWHKYYTASPIQDLTNLRLEHAKKMLEQTNRKIYEISDECGFCDVIYFSCCFKKTLACLRKFTANPVALQLFSIRS